MIVEVPGTGESFELLRVGTHLDPSRKRWPEGPHWGLHGGCHELLLSYRSPSGIELHEIRNADPEFGLYRDPPLLLLTYRFGILPWSDAPFDWHRCRDTEKVPELLDQGEHIVIHLILLDAATGVIEALRVMTWSPEFSAAVVDAIRDQAMSPADDAGFESKRLAAYASMSSSDIAARCGVRCRGGE